MGVKLKKYTVPFFLFFFIAMSAFLAIKSIQLKKANTGYLVEIDDLSRKESALKKKYSEEKAMANTMQRAKLSADSKIRTLESEVEGLKKEIEKANSSQDTIVKDLKRNVDGLKNSLKEMTLSRDNLKTRYDEITTKLKTASETVKKKDAQLTAQLEEMNELQSKLAETSRKVERAVDHNKKLAELSEELLAEFDDRDVFSSLMEKEPFTQQKRVRLERMIQEYLDRIDSEILRDPNNF